MNFQFKFTKIIWVENKFYKKVLNPYLQNLSKFESRGQTDAPKTMNLKIEFLSYRKYCAYMSHYIGQFLNSIKQGYLKLKKSCAVSQHYTTT